MVTISSIVDFVGEVNNISSACQTMEDVEVRYKYLGSTICY